MKRVTYYIPNISCHHCIHTIKKEVGALEGVRFVSGDVKAKQVTLEIDAPATEEQVKAVLAEIDYPVAKEL